MPGSEGPWFRPAVLDVPRPFPSSQVVHQLSRTTHIRFEGPWGHQLAWTSRGRVQVPTVSIAVLGDSGLCPRSGSVDQQYRGTRAIVERPTVSISCPGRLGTVNKCPRCRSALLRDSGPCPKSRRVDLLSRAYRAIVQGPRSRSLVPGDSHPCPRSRAVDQLSLTARTRVRFLEVSTSCPRLLTIRSVGPRCRPAVLDDSGLGQTSHDVDQLSQTIRDRVQGPACLTHCPGNSGPCPSAHGAISSPGRLGPVPVGPRCLPAVPGDLGQ